MPRPRSLTATRRPSRWRGVLVGAAGAALTVWGAGSAYYIAFHDQILAGVMSRQAEMQYAYEDRIAELRTALDEARLQGQRTDTSQAVESQSLEAQAARLSARIDDLDALVSGKASTSAASRLRAARDAAGQPLGERLKALAGRQAALVGDLTTRAENASQRIQTALAELGLATAPRAGMGGPFVPLDVAKLPDGGLAVLRGALQRRRQLERVADRLPLRQPVTGPLDITSGYGARRDPFLGRLALHTGTDLRQPYGSPVRAAAAGIVTAAGPESGYGTMVAIDHGNGYSTRYAHLSRVSVRVGDSVAAGANVGEIGTSGRSTGPHLHYEVRIAGEPVDPARYLSLAAAIGGD